MIFSWASFLPSPLVPGIAALLISLSFLWITSKACCVTLPPETSPTSVLAKSFRLRLHCMVLGAEGKTDLPGLASDEGHREGRGRSAVETEMHMHTCGRPWDVQYCAPLLLRCAFP